MKGYTAVLLILGLVLSIACVAFAQEFSVTATLDYEAFSSETYVRFTIDKPDLLPIPEYDQERLKLFDIQLPSAFTNIVGGDDISKGVECTRTVSTTDSSPFLTFSAQSEERRGYEVMYNTKFEKTGVPIHCVIKIKPSPDIPTTVTSGGFSVTLLAAAHIFMVEGKRANRHQLSFTIPQFYTQLTSTRVYPDAYPFIFPGEDYTTSITIDAKLLSLRKNNKLIIKYPFDFYVQNSLSFCSSPHSISAYDFNSQSPVESTQRVEALSISLTSYSAVAQGISCYLVIRTSEQQPRHDGFEDTLKAYRANQDIPAAVIPAGRVEFMLEYTQYASTGSSGSSNFFYSFLQRSFQVLEASELFPAYDAEAVMSTPPLVTHSRVRLSPIFLNPDDEPIEKELTATMNATGFWNRYSVQFEYFSFKPNQALWIPGPSSLTTSNDCIAQIGKLTNIQVDSCVQSVAVSTCPDFQFRFGFDHHNQTSANIVVANMGMTSKQGSIAGTFFTPKEKLRFSQSSCFYDFKFSPTAGKAVEPEPLKLRLISLDIIQPVSLQAFSYILTDELGEPDWTVQSRIFYSPQCTVRPSAESYSFVSPLVGGSLEVFAVSPKTPLFDGFRIEILGPRLTEDKAVYIRNVWTRKRAEATPDGNAVLQVVTKDDAAADLDSDWVKDPSLTDPNCVNCFRLGVESLQYRASGGTSLSDGYHNYPVLTFKTDNTDGIELDMKIEIAYPGTELLFDETALNEHYNVQAYHYQTFMARTTINQTRDLAGLTPNVFFTMAKNLDDIYDVFGTINFVTEWQTTNAGPQDSTTPFQIQAGSEEEDDSDNTRTLAQKIKSADYSAEERAEMKTKLQQARRSKFLQRRKERLAARQAQEMTIQSTSALGMDVLQTSSTSSSASTDEWFIYDQGYIGIALSNINATRGDVITLMDSTVQFMKNFTTISNVVKCFGNIDSVDYDSSMADTLLIISTDSTSIQAVFNRDLAFDQLLICTAPITPRTPAQATELLSIPTLRFYSQKWAPPTSLAPTFAGSTYRLSSSEADSTTTASTYEYPFTYEIPLDIANLADSLVELTSLDAPENERFRLYTGSYATLQLRVEGRELQEGQSNVITIDFTSGRLAAVDQDLTTVLTASRELKCDNAEVSINYNTRTKVEITLSQRVVATKLDPFICQFAMMVGTGLDDTDTPVITFGTSTEAEDIITNPALEFQPPPYDVSVAQSEKNMIFTMNKMGPLPIMFLQVTPFTTMDKTCKSSTGAIIADIEFSQAIGVLVVTPRDEYSNGIDMYSDIRQTCTFAATKKFNSASTTVYFQLGSQILADTLTLPAIASDVVDDISGVDITFSSIKMPWFEIPLHGIMLDLFQTAVTSRQYVQIELPTGARRAIPDPNSELDTAYDRLFRCDERLGVEDHYSSELNAFVVTFSPTVDITAYDEVTCAVRLTFSQPVSQSDDINLTGKRVKKTSSTNTEQGDDLEEEDIQQKTTWSEVSSEYQLFTSYGLRYSYKWSKLELILEMEYTSLYFDVKSNKLMFDLSGMKSPIDQAPFVVEGAGGDPTVRTKTEVAQAEEAANADATKDTDVSDTETKSGRGGDNGIKAGHAVIGELLTAADCFVPQPDAFGAVNENSKVSAQYIRETGFKLVVSLPPVKANTPTIVRCVVPVYIYNQQFRVTPLIKEFPTSRQFVRSSGSAYDRLLPYLAITTWFPSPSIDAIDDTDQKDDDANGGSATTPVDAGSGGGSTGGHSKWDSLAVQQMEVSRIAKAQDAQAKKENPALNYVQRAKYLGSNNPNLQVNVVPYVTNSNKQSARLAPVDPKTIAQYDITSDDEQYLFFNADVKQTEEPPATDGTTPSDMDTSNNDSGQDAGATTQDPRSSTDLTQDIRYLEILFKNDQYFTNDQLDDIVTIIHSLVSKRDRTINLNSIIVIGQSRPPRDDADKYVLLRLGFAGLDVESTLLEAKFAGLDYMHWLSNSYQVEPNVYGNDAQYRYDRTKVPITCLTTSAALNQITRTCGSECGRTCPTRYESSKQARPCRSDFDCESFSCDTAVPVWREDKSNNATKPYAVRSDNPSSYKCRDQRWNYVTEYTGIYENFNTNQQTGVPGSEIAVAQEASVKEWKNNDGESGNQNPDDNTNPDEQRPL